MIVYKKIPKDTYDVCIIHLADARFYPFFKRQAETLCDRGYKVALVSWENKKGNGDPHWPKIDVYPICISSKQIKGKIFFIKYFFCLTYVLLKLKARLYEAVDPPALIPALISSFYHKTSYNYFSLEYFKGIEQLVKKPVIRFIWTTIERIGILGAKNVAAVCDTTKMLLKKDYKIKNTFTILNVPKKSEYNIYVENGFLRKKIGITNKIPVIIYKGEITFNRGLLPFVNSLLFFDIIHFVILGDGILRQRLIDEVKRFNLTKRVHFLEPVSSDCFVNYLKDANAGILLHENNSINMRITLPSRLFDYIHAKIPIIASKGEEVSPIIEKYNIGWLVDGCEKKSLTEALNQFMLNFNNLDKYKKNCQIAANDFCWEKESEKYLLYIENAIKK
jgi:glycosyltransferase involved in cell wall biosynthesis